jgi:hypothetical protein
MNKSSFTGFLSLCQRERIKVRDCPTFVAQVLPRLFQERYRGLREPDDSKSGRPQFLERRETVLARSRVAHQRVFHVLNHLVRRQVLRLDSRNLGYKDRSGAVGETCSWQTFDFAALATICVHTLSSSCGGNERGSLFHFLIAWVSREEKSKAPHLNPLPVSGERRTAT